MLEFAAIVFLFELGVYLAFLIRKEVFEHQQRLDALDNYIEEELPPTQWPISSEDG